MEYPIDVVNKINEVGMTRGILTPDDKEALLESISESMSSVNESITDFKIAAGLGDDSQEKRSRLSSHFNEPTEKSFDSNIFPVVESKCTKLDEKSSERIPDDLESKSKYFENLVKGMTETAEFNQNLDPPPEWLDLDKFRRGQKFARKNEYATSLSEMMSLILLFSTRTILQSLMFTGKSDTPFRAFQRYISTVNRLRSWYGGELWCEEGTDAKKNIKYVNQIHEILCNRLSEVGSNESITLKHLSKWSPMIKALKEEFRRVIPPRGPYPRKPIEKVWFNQMDMAFTQWAFMGLMVTYPTHFGLFHIKEEDLEDFVHFWRGLGHLLGIKDEYNFCNDGLKEVRQRTYDFIEYAAKPALRDVDENWEHMSRCLITGISFYVPGTTFESSLLYLFKVIELDVPIPRKHNSCRHIMRFRVLRTMNFLQRIPCVTRLFNRTLQHFILHANSVSEETLEKWKNSEYNYKK